MTGAIHAVILAIGAAAGFIVTSLFTASDDDEVYQEGFRDGKNEIRTQMDDLCSHCGKRTDCLESEE